MSVATWAPVATTAAATARAATAPVVRGGRVSRSGISSPRSRASSSRITRRDSLMRSLRVDVDDPHLELVALVEDVADVGDALEESSEMWTRPSWPGRISTKAP